MEKKYHVAVNDFDCDSMLYPVGSRDFNTPKEALDCWFEEEPKHRTCVAICSKTNEDARELIKYAIEHKDYIMSHNDCTYKLDYLVEQCINKYPKEKLISWEYDQVHPFCMG